MNLVAELVFIEGDANVLNATINISIENIASIVWLSNNNLSYDDCLSSTLLSVSKENYSIIVIVNNSSVAEASINIIYEEATPIPETVITNIFFQMEMVVMTIS